MFPKGCREIPEHRVRVAGHRHQIRRRGELGDRPCRALECSRLDPHMKRGAHIEAHRQPVQLRHDDVFQTRALQLLAGPEHFRSDEAGDIVDDRPRTGLAAEVSRDAVGARLERHHVNAFRRTVGDGGSLAGLEVTPGKAAREIEHAINVESDHPAERRRRAGQALETDVDRRALTRPRLLDDVREHAVASGQLQPIDDLEEQSFEADDRLDVVARRIEPDDDVATAVGQPLEDRAQDLLVVVAGAVGLDARSQVPRRANRGPAARQWIEERAGHGGEFGFGHDLDDGRDRFAPQAVAMAPDPAGASRAQQDPLHLSNGQIGHGGKRLRIQRPVERIAHAIVNEGAGHYLAQLRGGDRPTCLGANGRIVGSADETIAFLEFVGEDETPAQLLCGHGSPDHMKRRFEGI